MTTAGHLARLVDIGLAQRAYETAATEAEELRDARNTAIRRALDDGYTHKSISDATGLSRGRINQIKGAA